MSFLLIVATANATAQQLNPIPFPLTHKNFSLAGIAEYVVANNGMENYKTILSRPFTILQNKGNEDFLQLSNSTQSTLIRFKITNTLLSDTEVVLKVNLPVDRMILYEQATSGLQKIGRSGSTIPFSQLSTNNDDKRIKISLRAGQTQTFLLWEQLSLHNQLSIPILQNEDQAILEEFLFEKAVVLPRGQIFLLFTGFHLAIFFFSLIKYFIQHKDKAYLYYCLSSIFICVIYLLEVDIINLESIYWNNLRNNREISFVFNVASSLSYLAFQNELLQLKTTKPVLLNWMKVYAGFVLLGVVLSLVFNQLQSFRYTLEYSLLFFQLGQILGTGVLAYITRRQQGFYKYVFYGSTSLLIAFCIFVIIFWSGLQEYLPAWFGIDTHIMLPAIALDVLFFLMALVYRDKQVEVEKVQAQQQLVEQMERNKMLQNSFTRNLEQQVKYKTQQLIEQRSVLEKERESKLIAEFEQKFSESELKALRSQINPHFIFNVLNTIESYALQNKPEVVSDMIQKFSKLTRLVLENSMRQVVPIGQDWEALRLYIELEQMRYTEPFKVIYDIEENVLEQDHLIPPMLIQPYVENAILHGLRNLQTQDGLLTIRGFINENYIIITIEDNGIGRQRASLLHVNSSIKKNSLGMKVTQDRIAIFNNLVKGKKAKILMEDRKRGTKVTLSFPLQL